MVYGYVSPEYFCDRITETSELIGALENGRNVTLLSPRRMGKTGLIKNAFYHITHERKDVLCFYVDIYSTRTLQEFVKTFGETVLGNADTFPQKLMDVIGKVLTHCRISYHSDKILGGKVTLEFTEDETEATLSDIFTYLSSTGKECFIAIDEFQQITEYADDKTEALLRTYVQEYPLIHFIFSGSKRHVMSDIFNTPHRPFFCSTEKMPLGEINEKEYFLFAEKHFEKIMTVLPEDTFHNLYDMFRGHTWYIQYVLNVIYQQAPAIVDDDLVRSAVKYIVCRNIDEYEGFYRMLSLNQQNLLISIAREGTVKSINSAKFIEKHSLPGTSSINKAVKFLVDREFLYQYADGYQVYDRFFAIWLRDR